MMAAKTPPRSISATSRPGAFKRRAKPEIAQIVTLQIQLGHAARAFDHDVLEARARAAHMPPARGPAGSRNVRSIRAPAECARLVPSSTTWLPASEFGLSRIGFMSGSGSSPQASACATCARPISPPPGHAYELFDMFCALNGATRQPRSRSQAQIAVAIQLFPGVATKFAAYEDGRFRLLVGQPILAAAAFSRVRRGRDRQLS